MLGGDDNDLLADVFEKAKPSGQSSKVVDSGSSSQASQETEVFDATLVKEIEIYISQVAENECSTVDMSDSPLGSAGAIAVASMIKLCKSLQEIHLMNCEIKDAGAIALFDELRQTTEVT